MAEEEIVYGQVAENGEDQTVEIKGGKDENNSKVEALMLKIAALEQEKGELVHQNEVITERVKKLRDEIEAVQSDKEEMKSEIERFEVDKKALESIAGRAAELEAEVSRLQHDLVSAMADGQEANAELSELKGVVAELRKSDSEKGKMIEVLEQERDLLLKQIEKDAHEVKELKADSDCRVRELEKKIEALEARESNLKTERVMVEEEARAKLGESEEQIRNFKNLFDESQSVVTRNKAEIERSNKKNEELEIVKNELEALLKKSERKVKEMEHKMNQLHTELEASEKMISGLKFSLEVEGINGKGVVDRAIVLDDGKRLMGLKLEWPVVAASAGALAAMSIFYLRYARQS